MGQVLGKDITEGTIEIIGNGRSSSELNDQCEFVLLGMPAGHYSLLLCLSDGQIEISDLALQS
jgi:hypothetical protein